MDNNLLKDHRCPTLGNWMSTAAWACSKPSSPLPIAGAFFPEAAQSGVGRSRYPRCAGGTDSSVWRLLAGLSPHFSRQQVGSKGPGQKKVAKGRCFHGITTLSRRSGCSEKERPLLRECKQESFSFAPHFSRRVEAGFTAGQVTSDGGALLLRQADRRVRLLNRLAACFSDGRNPERIEHTVAEMLAQRIYGLALGYEDLNDHEQLRCDPLLGLLSGKRKLEDPLAGKSTLNRLELTGRSSRYHKIDYSAQAIDRLLCDLFIESHTTMPDPIVLDLDATDIPLYGHQPERFFRWGGTATTTATAICRSISSPAISCCAPASEQPTRTRLPARSRKWRPSWRNCGSGGRK